MSEEVKVETETVTIRTDYSGNAESDKTDEKKEKPVAKQVVSGKLVKTVQKKWYQRLSEAVTGDEAKGVLGYVVFDVAVPALRDMAFDVVKEGAQRAFYGDSAPRNSRRGGGAPARTNYGAYSKQDSEPYRGSSNERRVTNRSRQLHDFTEIVFESRGEVEMVIDELVDAIKNYGEASVADFYRMVGQEAKPADERWGWTEVHDILQPTRNRDGWIFEARKPQSLLP